MENGTILENLTQNINFHSFCLLNSNCLISYNINNLNSNKIKLTLEERSRYKITNNGNTSYLFYVFIGLLLGDGHVHRNKSRSITKKQVGKRTLNSRFQFAQATIRAEYLFYIYSIFSNYCSARPFYYCSYHKTFKQFNTGYYFNTMTLPCFNYFRDIFYDEKGIKIIPNNIYFVLTPISLAFFICDDGTYHIRDKYLVLCTDNFSHSDVLKLIYVLENKFSLKCRTERKNKGLRVVIKPSSMDHLRFLVKDHIHPSMLYKLGLPRNKLLSLPVI